MEVLFGGLAIILSVVVGLIIFARLFDVRVPGLSFITAGSSDYAGYVPDRNDIYDVAWQALFFRIVMHFVSYLMLRLVYMDGGQTYLQWWTKWDATNYIGIATGGYICLHVYYVMYICQHLLYQQCALLLDVYSYTWLLQKNMATVLQERRLS